jgi:pimeloyl-ACP methyl ester carboxylesterase
VSDARQPFTVQDRFVRLGDLRFHYRDWGNPGAPPLLLLHGMTGHARGWDTFAAAMVGRFRVLALDQRGHGESDRAPDYPWERWLDDVESFVRTLALDPLVVIGHSFGGVVAYMYAARHSGGVVRLVVVDIGPPPEGTALPPPRGPFARLQHVFADPDEYLHLARRLDPDAREEELRHGTLHNLVRQPDGRWALRWDAALRAADFELPLPDLSEQWAALRALACPTLVIRGQHGTFPREHAERMVSAIPDARLIEIAAAGHSVHWGNPDAFCSAIREFLLDEPPGREI